MQGQRYSKLKFYYVLNENYFINHAGFSVGRGGNKLLSAPCAGSVIFKKKNGDEKR